MVEAWVDDYIQLGDQRVCQKELRTEILARCKQLDPSDRHVLHATFFGAKPVTSDVENLLLYNVGSFAVAGRNGIRFEYGAGVPQTPDGAQYRFCYRYTLVPRTSAFTKWQQGRSLASFDWTDLGAFKGDKKLTSTRTPSASRSATTARPAWRKVSHQDLAVGAVRLVQVVGQLLQPIGIGGHQNQVITIGGAAASETFAEARRRSGDQRDGPRHATPPPGLAVTGCSVSV